MYKCPYCHKPGISTLRKLCLGPALPAKCKKCVKKVGVPWGKSFLVMLPFIILAVALVAFTVSYNLSWIWTILIIVILFILSCFAYLRYVPLIKNSLIILF